jgi:hypothetical protein
MPYGLNGNINIEAIATLTKTYIFNIFNVPFSTSCDALLSVSYEKY